MGARIGSRWAIAGAFGLAGIGLLAWALIPREPPPPQPNVLFVVWDTVRADRLSVYGHDKPTTPFLESIARDALVYDRAISPSYWTLPAHASMFTGLPVSSHGANAKYKWLDSRFVHIAEHYRDNGYDTYAFSSNPNINRSANTTQGFSTFHQPFAKNNWRRKVEQATRALLRPDDNTTPSDPDRYRRMAFHKSGSIIDDALMGWVANGWDKEKPFFAFVNYMEAHSYRLPSEAATRSVLTPRQSRRALNTNNLLKPQRKAMYGTGRPLTRNARAGLYDLYDASIWDLDRYLAELFADLSTLGLLENTIVVVTSDHGEQFGEHGLYLHNYSVYQPLVHVPLMIHFPRELPGRRIDEPVSTVSLFHTLNQLTGVPAPDQPIDSQDLTAALGGVVVSELTAPCAHPENRRLDPNIRDWEASYRAVVSGTHKLIEASNGALELFDLATDPNELQDLAASEPERTAELRKALQQWREATPDIPLTAAEEEANATEREAEQDDELMEELRGLGYVED